MRNADDEARAEREFYGRRLRQGPLLTTTARRNELPRAEFKTTCI